MNTKFFIAVLLLSIMVFCAVAQEIEFPLSSNPVIKEYLKKNPVAHQSQFRTTRSVLSLPFQDDFSGKGIFPNSQLWMDSDVFINQTYCDTPITIGVATFDGINKYGEPHDSNSTSATPVICDYLTSLPIDLSTVSAGDSVYFSFYYQPQGLGDEPEDGDSLVLQFYSFNGVDSAWVNIWVAGGTALTPFNEVRINLTNANYFWNGFQFRFYNYANPNGNRDHWNIDYVKLKANEFVTQPLKEIALLFPVQSYLEEFTAMPYAHYKSEFAAGRNPVKTNIDDDVRLYTFTGSTSLTLNDTVRNRAGAIIFTGQSQPDLNPTQNTTDSFNIGLAPQLFDVTSGDMTDFTIRHSFSGLAAGDSSNDKSDFTQHFYNYYSYDDGSAESATGVHVAYTKYAYQFDVKMADSLIGISIYFNPWGKNVHQDLFSLCLWNSLNLGSNTDVLIHQSIDNKPANNDSINGFVDYYFDTAQWVNAGTNYIGIIQSSINEIGIGVDHNTDAHSKMYLNYNNQWVQSTIKGSWMMRPIFNKKLTIGVNEIAQNKSQFDIFPNPTSGKFTIHASRLLKGAATEISIYNIVGEKVRTETINLNSAMQFDMSDFPSGLYFVHFIDELNLFSEVKKLVVQH